MYCIIYLLNTNFFAIVLAFMERFFPRWKSFSLFSPNLPVSDLFHLNKHVNALKNAVNFKNIFCFLQLILKTKTSSPLSIHFFALKGPFYDMKVNTQIYKHDFTDQENESEYFLLPLPDSSECNRLLASKAINFRLIMFLLSK